MTDARHPVRDNTSVAETGMIVRRAIAFVVVTFGTSLVVWLPLIASHRGWIGVELPANLAALGIFGPASAAIILRIASNGRTGLRSFWADAIQWRFGRQWWVAVLLVPPGLIGGMYAAYLLLGGDVQTASTVTMLRDAGTLAVIIVPVMVVVIVVLAFGEEAGW